MKIEVEFDQTKISSTEALRIARDKLTYMESHILLNMAYPEAGYVKVSLKYEDNLTYINISDIKKFDTK